MMMMIIIIIIIMFCENSLRSCYTVPGKHSVQSQCCVEPFQTRADGTLMFTQVTCPQVIRPTVVSAAAPYRRNVGHWVDQSDPAKHNCFRQVFIRLSRHQRRGTGGTSAQFVLFVEWLQTQTQVFVCGNWKSPFSFSRYCHKRICKILRAG